MLKITKIERVLFACLLCLDWFLIYLLIFLNSCEFLWKNKCTLFTVLPLALHCYSQCQIQYYYKELVKEWCRLQQMIQKLLSLCFCSFFLHGLFLTFTDNSENEFFKHMSAVFISWTYLVSNLWTLVTPSPFPFQL